MTDKRDEMPRISPPPHAAAGVGAVISTAGFLARNGRTLAKSAALLELNQKSGFDCPGCAWPDPDENRPALEFCENGAKAIADEIMKPIPDEFFAKTTIEAMRSMTDFELGQQGRLARPLIRKKDSDRYEPIAWNDAFDLVASSLNALSSPDHAAFYASGRTSNEAAFLYQLLARSFGTNNLPDCSDLCHESSGYALNAAVGVGKGSVSLDDFMHADLIFVCGQNPGTNHPRMLTTLQSAKRRGAKIVAINPLPEPGLMEFRNPKEVSGMLGMGTPLADEWLPVRINGDVALLQGLGKHVLELAKSDPQVLDRGFIDTKTTGFPEYSARLAATSWTEIECGAGIERSRIERVAALYARSQNVIFCWAMGLTQHKNAIDNIREVVNLMGLRGQMGKKGAGVCPVRGHSNVQGDRTMGILERPSDAFLAALDRTFAIESPRNRGLDSVETMRTLGSHRIQFFMALGGNIAAAMPDSAAVAAALRSCPLTAHVSTKLNRSHAECGEASLILPCLGRSERDAQASGPQFVSVEDSMSVVHKSQGHRRPASPHLRSEVNIVCEIGSRIRPHIAWTEFTARYDLVRDKIALVVPGFENFNARIGEGFCLPHAVRDEQRFPTASGKLLFAVNEIPRWELNAHEFLLMTIRSHDQFNTTIYGLNDRYRGVANGRRVLFINREDMLAENLKAGDLVDIVSLYSGIERYAAKFLLVPFDIPRRSVAAYFPEANAVIPLDETARGSNTPISKSVRVVLRRIEGLAK